LPVDRYVSPEQFVRFEEVAKELGFWAVAAGPLVRSSYRAGELLASAQKYQDSTFSRDLG
jgi:lipoic acid synthetase